MKFFIFIEIFLFFIMNFLFYFMYIKYFLQQQKIYRQIILFQRIYYLFISFLFFIIIIFFFKIVATSEMREFRDILNELNKVTTSRDEFSAEVASLSEQLEQEKTKVSLLQEKVSLLCKIL